MSIIDHRTEAHGYYWRYDHPAHEPSETLDAAIMLAVEVASTEARKSHSTYFVACTHMPIAVYAVRADHPDISAKAMSVMYHASPKGKVIRQLKPNRH
jgi:hypothetical protein